jgi:hypothetical protein
MCSRVTLDNATRRIALVSQLSQRFYGRLKRDDGVGNMQLVDVDALQAKPLETSLDRLTQVSRSGIVGPLVRAGAVPSALGRNRQPTRVREEGLGNQFLAYVWAVGIRGVNEIDVKFHGTAKNC